MRLFYFILTGIVVSVFISCQSNTTGSEQAENPVEVRKPADETVKTVPPQGFLEGDTISMNSRFVLFYDISEAEDRSSTVFSESVRSMIDSLNSAGSVTAFFTTASNVKIYKRNADGPMIMDLHTFPEKTGMVMSDGLQPPVIRKGDFKPEDYAEHIRKYFLMPS